MCFSPTKQGVRLRRSVVLSVVFQVQAVLISGQINVHSSEIVECTGNGTYLRANSDGSRTCYTCSTCPKGFRVMSFCTRSTDTVCESCSPGTYNDVPDGICKECSRCMPGSYVNRKCDNSTDITCKKCLDGYFSDYHDSEICRRCKVCGINEKTTTICSGQQDTVCGDCVRDHFRDQSTLECVPCSLCYLNVSVIVPECQAKLGHSQEVCQPLGYVPRTKTELATTVLEQSSTAQYPTTEDMEKDPAILLVAILSFFMVTPVLILIAAVIMRRSTPQKVVRLLRDNVFKKASHHIKQGSKMDREDFCACCVANKRYSPRTWSSGKLGVDNKLACTEVSRPNAVKMLSKDQHRLLEEDGRLNDAESGVYSDCKSLCNRSMECECCVEVGKSKSPVKQLLMTGFADQNEAQYNRADTQSDYLSVADSGIDMHENLSTLSMVTCNNPERDGYSYVQTPVAPSITDARSHRSGRIQHVATIETKTANTETSFSTYA